MVGIRDGELLAEEVLQNHTTLLQQFPITAIGVDKASDCFNCTETRQVLRSIVLSLVEVAGEAAGSGEKMGNNLAQELGGVRYLGSQGAW